VIHYIIKTMFGIDLEAYDNVADRRLPVCDNDGTVAVPIGIEPFVIEQGVPDEFVGIQHHFRFIVRIDEHNPFFPAFMNATQQSIGCATRYVRKNWLSSPNLRMIVSV